MLNDQMMPTVESFSSIHRLRLSCSICSPNWSFRRCEIIFFFISKSIDLNAVFAVCETCTAHVIRYSSHKSGKKRVESFVSFSFFTLNNLFDVIRNSLTFLFVNWWASMVIFQLLPSDLQGCAHSP
jgi:hypothetical protein